MTGKNLLYSVAGFSVLLSISCNKSKPLFTVDVTQSPPKYESYFPYKKGNYWIYEFMRAEQNGVITSLNKYDSVYVEKDTVIRGNIFWKIRQTDFLTNKPQNLYLRDSLHYIIQSDSRIIFSSMDFSTVFYPHYDLAEGDTISYSYMKMNDKDLTVSTKAGNFVTSNFQTTYELYYGKKPSEFTQKKYSNAHYCRNTGLIKKSESVFAAAPFYDERRLVRYHLN